jgi:N-methylhydantoinase A/oxoprolinase/acetone carboxylase beta subunit
MGLLVSIDNGGTLTDICAFEGSKVYHAKTLTTPHDLSECLMVSLAALAQQTDADGDLLRLVASIEHLRYSTTQGTNAIAQRKGPRLGLLVQTGEDAQALRGCSPELYDTLVGPRMAVLDGCSDHSVVQAVRGLVAAGASRLVVCLDGDAAADREMHVRRLLYAAFPRHLLGAVPLLFSTELAPGTEFSRRAWSSLLNAFLHPSMEQFLHHAESRLRQQRIRNPLLVFRNDGGSTRVARTIALHTYSSGPRGGAEGGGVIAAHYALDRVVSIDIGGTTTDLAMLSGGRVAEHAQGHVETAPIAFPIAEVPSMAAGGGSVLAVCNGAVTVGPESMGALPGPACFGRGGTQATITDVMLLTGVIDPASYFGGQMTLDRERSERAVEQHLAAPLRLTIVEALARAEAAYDSVIAEAVRSLAGEGGADALLAFGGAGPMSACGIAERAGISRVLVPRFAAVFSAFGIGFSPIRHEHRHELAGFAPDQVADAQAALARKAERAMQGEGFNLADCAIDWRAIGQDGASGPVENHSVDRPGTLVMHVERPIAVPQLGPASAERLRPAMPCGTRAAGGALALYRVEDMQPGDWADGPCLIEEQFFTCQVRSGWRFVVTGNHDLMIEREV